MILQALKAYYDRKSNDPESGIAPLGWEYKEIPFLFVIDREGRLVGIEDTREGEGRKKRARVYCVPKGEKKTSGVKANLMWDSSAYLLGIDADDKPGRAMEKKQAFLEKMRNAVGGINEGNAIIRFLEQITIEELSENECWDELSGGKVNMTFRFEGHQMIACGIEPLKEAIDRNINTVATDDKCRICLVTGERESAIALHPAIKGVAGALQSGGNIVSFNLPCSESYGKAKGQNAPVGEPAAFAYTTALNWLLDRGSRQHFTLGKVFTAAFWSEQSSSFEKDFVDFFTEDQNDPNGGTEKIKALLESPSTGAYMDDDKEKRFFVLGLSSNAARLSIRFWEVGSISIIAARIRSHFHDLTICRPKGDPEYYSIWRILSSISLQDKIDNLSPRMAGEFMEAVLTGKLYPATALQETLRRIRSDARFRVKPVRAAFLKAYLNRYHRVYPSTSHKEITMGLDTSQPSIGYQLGRLFAGLERIQEDASPGLNATIRERYYGAACSSPVTVFPILLRLKNHHLAKIANKGRVVNLERLLSEIVDRLDDFPFHLGLHEQGRFAIGYYHQRQSFYNKPETE